MKKTLLVLLFLSITPSVWGERFQDYVHSVEKGQGDEEHLLKLSSGRVIFFDSEKAPYYRPEDFREGDRLEVEVDQNLNVKSLTALEDEADGNERIEVRPRFSYEPTILPDYPSAKRIFRGMNRSYKRRTECSDRAHVWSYEEWKKHDLYQNKAFLFFTNTYIRKYRFKWWFHVAPYVLVKEGGEVVEHVMDRKYISYPYHMKNWTDVFVKSKKACPVNTYRYYRSNKNGPEHCIIVKTSMYYRLPYHVRMMEDQGRIKSEFSTSEVNFSYRAFRRRH